MQKIKIKVYLSLGVVQSVEISSSCFDPLVLKKTNKYRSVLTIKGYRARESFLSKIDMQENNCIEICGINLALKFEIFSV